MHLPVRAILGRSSRLLGLATAVLLAGPISTAHSAEVRTDELYRAAQQLIDKQASEVEQLAAWCEQQGLVQRATKTRELLGKRDPYKLYLPVLPERLGRAKLPADAPSEVVQWDERFARLRRDQAVACYDLARRAVRGRRASLAFDLALAAIRADPDHEPVRRLLGYQKHQGRWQTSYAVRQLRSGRVWHQQFGWLPKSHVRRYEQGMRFTGRSWVTAAEDAQLHRDIQSGWIVDTEHYSIGTNHSLQAGVQLGVKLQRLFRVWRQVFLPYYASQADVIRLFDGRRQGGRGPTPRFNVVYFRDRDDYNRSLRAMMPNIDVSIGFYHHRMRRACFFAGEDADDRTLYHEAAHQLFHESRPVAADVGLHANFWIVEGIAMYMESLRREGDYWVLGGFDDQRMAAARYRLLQDDFYVPLEEFTTFGMEKLQKDPRIRTLYSQAAGLTNFLVYYDGGRYRDALVAYLTAVYTGRDHPGTLAQLTGTSYTRLDQQYRQFIKQSLAPPRSQAGAGVLRRPFRAPSGHLVGQVRSQTPIRPPGATPAPSSK